MVKYVIGVTASLKGCTDLMPQEGCDSREFAYYIKVQCSNSRCGYQFTTELCATLSHMLPSPDNQSRISAKKLCPDCNSQGWIKLVPGHGIPLSITANTPAPLMIVRTSGLTPTAVSFHRDAAWCVRSLATGKMVDVNLSSCAFLRPEGDGEEHLRIDNLQGVVSTLRRTKKKNHLSDGKRTSGGAHCKSCNRNFKTQDGLRDHSRDKHGGSE